MTLLKTLSPENKFRFVCPILGSEEKIADCFAIYDAWMVNKTTPGREGCNACQASNKCPIWHIEQRTRRGEDDYHASEPEVGTLHRELLERIQPIVTQIEHLNRYGVTSSQSALIARADGMKGKLFTGKNASHSLAKIPETTQRAIKPSVAAPVLPSAIATAAATGDMSAAINIAMQAQPTPLPTSSPIPPMPAPAPVPPTPESRPMSLLERARQHKETYTHGH